MQDFKASDYPEVYKQLKIDTGNLGCVMLDVEPIVVSDIIPEDSLYYDESEDSYTQGIVSEKVPHVTLLYGLLQSGQLWSNQIEEVLSDWTLESPTITGVEFFYPNKADDHYITIVAKVEVTDNLLEAHKRLSLLPHINTFPNYTPHLTLAYVKDTSPWQEYVKALDAKYAGVVVKAHNLNFGDK